MCWWVAAVGVSSGWQLDWCLLLLLLLRHL
jgi:hypothetical protein